jgi:hypothetical protein
LIHCCGWTYLSLDRPWLLTKRPERRPHATNTWHTLDVDDKKTLVVVPPALETNTLSSRPALVVEGLGRVYTEQDVVAAGRVETIGHGCRLIDIVYESVVEIAGFELEGVEPILAIEALLLLVLGSSDGKGQGRQNGANAQKEWWGRHAD